MASERKCLDCGAPLPAHEPQPVCPRCIFQRFAKTGSTVYPPESAFTLAATEPTGRDFHAEYELLGEIGRGGMGVIYKAHHARLNRIVALKVIHAASVGGEGARRRFQSEVEVAARLNHPNIVPIFDTGAMDGSPCFSMEFFSGGSLAQRMNQFTSQPEAGVRLLVKVARAIFFAHQHGVLHRDLKPANILLDGDGEPHVGDFGLAKQLDSDSDLTRSGAVIGSPNYMSPEQAAGKSGSLTVATDIYSLGVMLYEMLTGRTPFVADTPLETMRKVIEENPERPSQLRSSRRKEALTEKSQTDQSLLTSAATEKVDRDLETICLKCLRKEPEQRYHTAEELADDLERWLRHEPIQARPITGLERAGKWMRRHPALAATTAMLVVAVVIGISGIIWQWRRAEISRREEATQRRRAEVALSQSALRLAESQLHVGDGSAATTILASVATELRDNTWQYLMSDADTSRPLPPIGITRLQGLAADPVRPSVFAAAGDGGRVVLFNVQSGSRLLEFVPEFPVAAANAELSLAFSRDGTRLAIGRTGPGGIAIHDAATGRKLGGWDSPPTGRLEFAPDSLMLLQVSADRKRVDVWDAGDGKPRWHRIDADQSAAFSADGREVINYCRSEHLWMLNASDGTPVGKLSDNYFDQFAIQPDGDTVVAGNSLGRVTLLDVRSGSQRNRIQPQTTPIRYVTFLPDGDRYLIATELPNQSFALQCMDLEGRLVQSVSGARGEIRAICLHPISGELIIGAKEGRVWETTGVPALRVLRTRHRHASAVFWGSDDTLFAPGPDETGAAFQSIAGTNAPAVLWTARGREHGEVSISADGRRAAFGWYHSPRPIPILELHNNAVTQVAEVKPAGHIELTRLSPNGQQLLIVEREFTQLEIIDVATGVPFPSLDLTEAREISDAAWLDQGRKFVGLVSSISESAAIPRRQLILWDAATGKRLVTVTNESVGMVACAEPNGRRFAEGGVGFNVRIRDGATLEILREFRAHGGHIRALAWHPTRPIIITASDDRLIRLWDLDKGVRIEEVNGPLTPPTMLSISPGGTRVATATRAGPVHIWEPRCLAPSSRQK